MMASASARARSAAVDPGTLNAAGWRKHRRCLRPRRRSGARDRHPRERHAGGDNGRHQTTRQRLHFFLQFA
jgi:hypothetical protein